MCVCCPSPDGGSVCVCVCVCVCVHAGWWCPLCAMPTACPSPRWRQPWPTWPTRCAKRRCVLCCDVCAAEGFHGFGTPADSPPTHPPPRPPPHFDLPTGSVASTDQSALSGESVLGCVVCVCVLATLGPHQLHRHRGDAGWHVHHLQRRRVRLHDGHPDHQPAPGTVLWRNPGGQPGLQNVWAGGRGGAVLEGCSTPSCCTPYPPHLFVMHAMGKHQRYVFPFCQADV